MEEELEEAIEAAGLDYSGMRKNRRHFARANVVRQGVTGFTQTNGSVYGIKDGKGG